ncbi:hypothetical protein RDI58_029977 [Solanum bulbocastanum]|uniref:Phytocyanin domain-containing protein n=1 Tax=Solanum bulbocastanum TaxID=147425 RepID=A0AAN8SSP2_SOLBU
MAQQRHVVVLLVLACLFTSSYSYQFTVGGKDGWVPKPSVDYNTWSQHMRFIINDSVLFKYKQGADSVLEVSKDDYDKCNTGNPIKKMEDGNSIFTLDRSGPFYFISGNKDNCDKGQKLQIIVISVRNQGKPPQTPAPGVAPPANAPAGSSTPGASSPNAAPVSTPAGKSPTSSPTPAGSIASPPAPATGGSVAPAMSPVANGPSTISSSPMAGGPSSGSGMAPAAGGPAGSMSPGPSAGGPLAGGPSAGAPGSSASGPGGSNTPADINSPAGAPENPNSFAPAAGGPAGSMSPGPSAGGPLAGGPSAGAPGSSASGPGGSNTPADINSPAGAPENPNSFAVKAFTPSIVLVSAVSLVLTVALREFIILP